MSGTTQEQIDQAKSLGYTDAQIEEYLNPRAQETTLPPPGTQVPGQDMFRSPTVGSGAPVNPANNPWVDRSQEHSGLVQGAALAGGGAAAAFAFQGTLGSSGLAERAVRLRSGPPPHGGRSVRHCQGS